MLLFYVSLHSNSRIHSLYTFECSPTWRILFLIISRLVPPPSKTCMILYVQYLVVIFTGNFYQKWRCNVFVLFKSFYKVSSKITVWKSLATITNYYRNTNLNRFGLKIKFEVMAVDRTGREIQMVCCPVLVNERKVKSMQVVKIIIYHKKIQGDVKIDNSKMCSSLGSIKTAIGGILKLEHLQDIKELQDEPNKPVHKRK